MKYSRHHNNDTIPLALDPQFPPIIASQPIVSSIPHAALHSNPFTVSYSECIGSPFAVHADWSHWWEQTADAALGEAATLAGRASCLVRLRSRPTVVNGRMAKRARACAHITFQERLKKAGSEKLIAVKVLPQKSCVYTRAPAGAQTHTKSQGWCVILFFCKCN